MGTSDILQSQPYQDYPNLQLSRYGESWFGLWAMQFDPLTTVNKHKVEYTLFETCQRQFFRARRVLRTIKRSKLPRCRWQYWRRHFSCQFGKIIIKNGHMMIKSLFHQMCVLRRSQPTELVQTWICHQIDCLCVYFCLLISDLWFRMSILQIFENSENYNL